MMIFEFMFQLILSWQWLRLGGGGKKSISIRVNPFLGNVLDTWSMKFDKLSEKISKIRSIGSSEFQDGFDLIDYLSL